MINLKPGGNFTELKINYGDCTCKKMKDWFNDKKRLAAIRNRRIFLLQCRSKKIYPKHIVNNLRCLYSLFLDEHPFKNDIQNLSLKLRKSILNLEIKITVWKTNQLMEICNNHELNINKILNIDDFNSWKVNVDRFYEKQFVMIKETNLRKINSLITDSNVIKVNTHEESSISNYTKLQLPENVKRILCVDPKFGVPPKRSDIHPVILIKDIEHCINNLPSKETDPKLIDNERTLLRSKVSNLINNFYNKPEPKHLDQFSRDIIETKKFLSLNQNVIVTKSDKGNGTVIMYKDEYRKTLQEMLQDEVIYKIINKDPTIKFEKMANDLLVKLNKNLVIDNCTMKNLKTHNAVAPRLYGLRKTHKEGCKLRPVVCCIGSPSYKISKLLHRLLTPLIATYEFRLKNSFEFVDEIKNIVLPTNYVLVSLDVVSLFTNIPQTLVLDIIDKDWDILSEVLTISKNMLIELIKFYFNSSYLLFDGKFYLQCDGSSMGNPASPVIADLVMNYIVKKVLTTLPFKIPILKLYVDDSFMAIPKDKVDFTLSSFNNFHPRIQFTMEIEDNCSLCFLDVKINRGSDGKLKTNWYQKPTSSGRLLNYYSNHPMSQKIGVIKGLMDRALRLSHEDFYEDNIEMKNLLINNNYPIKLINRFINNYKLVNNKKDVQQITTYFKFPYIKELSSSIDRFIRPRGGKLAFYNIKTINTVYSKLKDPIPLLQQSGLIYKIPCSCGSSYIGQTNQRLEERLKQHKNDCKNINYVKPNKTALAMHHFDVGHQFQFENVSILHREQNIHKRNLSEMVYIKINKTVNLRSDTQGLSLIYNDILNKIKT